MRHRGVSMWFPEKEIRSIQQVLRDKKQNLLSQLLQDVFKEPEGNETAPPCCPVCRQKLVPKAFPYLEYFVKACPNQHGLWMSSDVCLKMRGFIAEQLQAIRQRRSQLAIAAGIAALLLVLNLLAHNTNPLSRLFQERAKALAYSRISPQYWPVRISPHHFPLPVKSGALNDQEERIYFQQVLSLLEEGLSNRMNIDDALKTRKKEEDYWALYEFYRERQSSVIERLENIEIPGRFQEFHTRVLKAAYHQLIFYERFTSDKIQDPSLKLEDLLQDRDLKASGNLLHEAFAVVIALCPDLDPTMRQALESRLCWFDIT